MKKVKQAPQARWGEQGSDELTCSAGLGFAKLAFELDLILLLLLAMLNRRWSTVSGMRTGFWSLRS